MASFNEFASSSVNLCNRDDFNMRTKKNFSSPYNILLGVTGSVATIKLNEIVLELSKKAKEKNIRINIKIVATNAASHFISDEWGLKIIKDEDEWREWQKKGDKVQHIELRKWADIFVIAPLDANTLAKIACGLCDNLLTCVCRAWDYAGKRPFLVFPTMNVAMFLHPITKKQIAELEQFSITVIPPVEKILACGDTGMGALPHPEYIASLTIQHLFQNA